MPAPQTRRRAGRLGPLALAWVLLAALGLSFACPAFAKAPPFAWRLRPRFVQPRMIRPRLRPAPVVDPAALALLETMLQAEKTLILSGVQTTTLYEGSRAVTSVQQITRRGDHAYRMDYQSPSALAGQVVVDNGQAEWHYFPGRRIMEVGPSQLGSLRLRLGPTLSALRRGRLNAVIVGQDQIAGHSAEVVQVSGTGPYAGARRFWIDPTNGAQLRIDIYGPGGQPVSTSYYTQVVYNPQLDKHAFAPPGVPPDTRIATGMAGQTLRAIPADSQAGFHVLTPGYLPAGFHFQSASQSSIAGEPLIGLQYSDGIVALSLYESPQRRPQPNKVSRPRPDVLIARINGIRVIMIGNLADQELRQVAQSLK